MRKLILLAALGASVSGCSVSKMIDAVELPSLPSLGGTAETETRAQGDRLDTIAFADAYCRNDGTSAVAATQILTSANPANAKAQLLHGIALDLAGQGIDSYRVLEGLAAGDHPATVSLKCGQSFVYSGTVTEVAQRRLFSVRTRLEALGAMVPLPDVAEAKSASGTVFALAARAPARDLFAGMTMAHGAAASEKAADDHAASGPGADSHAAKPPAPKAGGLFVHLGSYRSMAMLDKGWNTLRAKYAKLLASQDRAVEPVDIRNKGHYLRLGVSVADRAEATDLCRRMKAGGAYCAVMKAGKS